MPLSLLECASYSPGWTLLSMTICGAATCAHAEPSQCNSRLFFCSPKFSGEAAKSPTAQASSFDAAAIAARLFCGGGPPFGASDGSAASDQRCPSHRNILVSLEPS